MQHLTLFAAEAAGEATGLAALGVAGGLFVTQLITFVIVFALLKRFAFAPIGRMLEKRRQTIDDGVRLGRKMEAEKAKLDEEVTQVMRDARKEADHIIATAQKESRDVIREAEKNGQRKADAMVVDAQARIDEEARHAKHKLEKEIVALISEATEAVVGEKVDAKKDAEIIDKVLKGRK